LNLKILKGSLVSISVSKVTHAANRIFYLAVPQEALLDVALSLADCAQSKQGWNRIIIEKPFGFTGVSSHRVTQSLLSRFKEEQIYR
jgi:glucose-6-phosphate 1-dehydrogenase